jgi:DNA replication protein DnaC
LTDTTVSPGDCPRCGGTGYVHHEEDGVRRAARCECRLQRRNTDRLATLQIPSRFMHCALEESTEGAAFHTNNRFPSLGLAKEKARRFILDYPAVSQGLLFMGPCGVGKTHLAVAILKALAMDKGVSGRFCDFHQLLREIKDSYNPVSGTSEMGLLEPVCSTPVLVLDDLGAEKPSPWVIDTLHFVINQRYLRRLTTLITTNFPDTPPTAGDDAAGRPTFARETLAERIGYRLRSRLYEMCHVIEMEGRDYRREIDRIWRS